MSRAALKSGAVAIVYGGQRGGSMSAAALVAAKEALERAPEEGRVCEECRRPVFWVAGPNGVKLYRQVLGSGWCIKELPKMPAGYFSGTAMRRAVWDSE